MYLLVNRHPSLHRIVFQRKTTYNSCRILFTSITRSSEQLIKMKLPVIARLHPHTGIRNAYKEHKSHRLLFC